MISLFLQILSGAPAWLIFSWLIWLALRWRNWTRPSVPIMLVYSMSVGIFYIKSRQALNGCIELCAPSFFVFPFIAAVSFWFLVLYIPIVLTLKPRTLFEQVRRNWWIAFPVIAFAAWHFSVAILGIICSLDYSPFIRLGIFSDFLFYPVLIILLSWLFWLLLPVFQLPTPTFLTMFAFSIAVLNAFIRIWMNAILNDRVTFSLPLFLLDVMIWFISLYGLTKLVLRMERQVPV